MADEKRKLVKTSDEFVEEVRELRRLEEEKRTVPIASGRFRELAETIVRKSREIMQRSILQEDLGDHAAPDQRSIEDVADEPDDGKP